MSFVTVSNLYNSFLFIGNRLVQELEFTDVSTRVISGKKCEMVERKVENISEKRSFSTSHCKRRANIRRNSFDHPALLREKKVDSKHTEEKKNYNSEKVIKKLSLSLSIDTRSHWQCARVFC